MWTFLWCFCSTGVRPSGLRGHGDGGAGSVLWCAGAQIRSAETYLLQGPLPATIIFTKKKTTTAVLAFCYFLFFCVCVIWPIRNILVGLLRPVLFWAVLNHLNFFPSVYRGPEHLPSSQGGKEIGADSALVTRRPRTTSSRAGENHTHTQKCFEECEKFNYKMFHCHSLMAIYVVLICNHFQWVFSFKRSFNKRKKVTIFRHKDEQQLATVCMQDYSNFDYFFFDL